jgi:hypothetical protein
MKKLDGALLLLIGLVAGVTASSCIRPAYYFEKQEIVAVAASPYFRIKLSDERTIDSRGAFILSRGDKESPMVFARAALIGEQGICFSSNYEAAKFWQGIQLGPVDLRIAASVIPADPRLRIVQTDNVSWNVTGPSSALRPWVIRHLRAVAVNRRLFVDIANIEYRVLTSRGWNPQTAKVLAEYAPYAPDPGWFGSNPSTLVGWRWDEFDKIGYVDVWPGSNPDSAAIRKTIGERDHDVRYAIKNKRGLSPGPCPDTSPVPLLASSDD